MTAISSPSLDYRQARQWKRSHRALAWTGVAGVHVLAAGAMVLAGMKPAVTPPEPAIMVSFISETTSVKPAPQPVPQPQPRPEPPKPQPTMIAAPRPTASPMTAAPAEPVRPAPVEAPPAPPSPPAPAAFAGPSEPAITPPNFRAAYLNNPGPKVPYEARLKRQSGTVYLKVMVSAAGRPESVQVNRSSGYASLDAAALDVVSKRWRFVPAKQGDRAVSASVIVPIQFDITER